MTEQRTVQYQQECITVTDVSGDYFGLPGTQIPVYQWLVCLPGYNTGLVFLGMVPAISLGSPGPLAVGMFAGIQYSFGIFGNGSGDFLGLPGTRIPA